MSQERLVEICRDLVPLGFSELEALVYAFLVENQDATGYAVAQGIGKPVANTYKAMESLQQKGAVFVDKSGKSRLGRAVPPADLLTKLDQQFEERRTAATQALARLHPVGAEERGLFALTTSEQVFEFARQMAVRAETIMFVDGYPAILEVLRPELEAAIGRDVSVVVLAYDSLELKGAEVIQSADAHLSFEAWPGQWIGMAIDGAEVLFGYLSDDATRVYHAVWSANTFVSWIQHTYIVDSVRFKHLERMLADGADADALRAEVHRTDAWFGVESRGRRGLKASLRDEFLR